MRLRRHPVSLLEIMYRLNFGHVTDVLSVFESLKKSDDAEISLASTQSIEQWSKLLDDLVPNLEWLGFTASLASLRLLRNELNREIRMPGEIRRRVDQLRESLINEFDGTYVLALSTHEAARLRADEPFGAEVTNAFPSATYDIDEATRCLAFGRATATVFHLMRVMEAGLKAFGRRVGVDTKPNLGWGAIISKADKQLGLPKNEREADWIEDEAFLSEASAMLKAVMTAWRHPTTHLEKIYTEEQAERIWGAVRGFMQQLATKLHE